MVYHQDTFLRSQNLSSIQLFGFSKNLRIKFILKCLFETIFCNELAALPPQLESCLPLPRFYVLWFLPLMCVLERLCYS